MKRLIIRVALLAVLCTPASYAGDACPPDGYSKSDLLQLRQSGFQISEDETRNGLALALLACVGHPDPEIRDGVVFEGLSVWLRGESLAADTVDALYQGLVEALTGEDDDTGFLKPFAALVLSEVARTDRIEAGFSPARRAELVKVAGEYMKEISDYRGFSDSEGWRHGVAHGSDLILQLVLNEEISSDQVRGLLLAVSGQVAPPGEVFYTYGEPARLARPVFYSYRRGIPDQDFWRSWFENVASPAPLNSWSDAYASNSGLARRHNTRAFLMAQFLNAAALEPERKEAFETLVMDALSRIQ
jgi:hypothetical protein